jgi:hypothetical protein
MAAARAALSASPASLGRPIASTAWFRSFGTAPAAHTSPSSPSLSTQHRARRRRPHTPADPRLPSRGQGGWRRLGGGCSVCVHRREHGPGQWPRLSFRGPGPALGPAGAPPGGRVAGRGLIQCRRLAAAGAGSGACPTSPRLLAPFARSLFVCVSVILARRQLHAAPTAKLSLGDVHSDMPLPSCQSPTPLPPQVPSSTICWYVIEQCRELLEPYTKA